MVGWVLQLHICILQLQKSLSFPPTNMILMVTSPIYPSLLRKVNVRLVLHRCSVEISHQNSLDSYFHKKQKIWESSDEDEN